METRASLPYHEQQRLNAQLMARMKDSPQRDKFFLANSTLLATGTVLTTDLVLWHTCYRAFNLHKYGRSRILSLLSSLAGVIPPLVWHHYCVRTEISSPYREENKWRYAMNSFLSYQYGLITCFGSCMAGTFATAQVNGCIPLGPDFLNKGKRMESLKFVIDALRPRCRQLGIVMATSSIFMFFLGARAYDDSCSILAKMNRKTIVFKEY